MSEAHDKPRVGVAKFSSCDGCQLTILDCEDALLDVAEHFDIIEFPEASSLRSPGPYDVLLVEGSITTAEQAHEIRDLRQQTKWLVTIGACATSGGVQALRNWADHDDFQRHVYPHPEFVSALATSTPIAEHVKVDAELRGCPISPYQLVEFLTASMMWRRPQLPDEAVCVACKINGNVCVVTARGIPCLGPVTRTGCGALCPSFDRGCYGCFGPTGDANVDSLSGWFTAGGQAPEETGRLYALFNAYLEPFRSQVNAWQGGAPREAASHAQD